jgi:hypothetical protein
MEPAASLILRYLLPPEAWSRMAEQLWWDWREEELLLKSLGHSLSK